VAAPITVRVNGVAPQNKLQFNKGLVRLCVPLFGACMHAIALIYCRHQLLRKRSVYMPHGVATCA